MALTIGKVDALTKVDNQKTDKANNAEQSSNKSLFDILDNIEKFVDEARATEEGKVLGTGYDMIAHNTYSSNPFMNNEVDNKRAAIDIQRDTVEGKILEDQEKWQAEMDKKTKEATKEAEAKYNPEEHGDNKEAFVAQYLSTVSGLNETYKLPQHLQTQRDSYRAQYDSLATKSNIQSDSWVPTAEKSADASRRMGTTIGVG